VTVKETIIDTTRKVVTYGGVDRGKLTKKQKADAEAWSGTTRERKLDAMMQAIKDESIREFGGDSIKAYSELEGMHIGLAMPSIAFEHLLDNDVWPLSTVAVICGPHSTLKSSLAFGVQRWFVRAGGRAVHLENESKFSNELYTSLVGGGSRKSKLPTVVHSCSSVDDWQARMTTSIASFKELMLGTKDEPGPGLTFPVCFCLDSLAGKSSEERAESVMKEGKAKRTYSSEALLISGYLKVIPREVVGWPFSLIFVNHLNDVMDPAFKGEKRMPGGGRIAYQETFELRTSKRHGPRRNASFTCYGIRLECHKNAIGECGRKIDLRMLQWDQPIGKNAKGETVFRKSFRWDWGWATIDFLSKLPADLKKRCRDVGFDLAVKMPTADVECQARCEIATGDKNWYSFTEVGDRIQANDTLMESLRCALAIQRRPVMEVGEDYAEQTGQD